MCKMFNYYSKGVEDYKLSETFFTGKRGTTFNVIKFYYSLSYFRSHEFNSIKFQEKISRISGGN